MTTYAFILGRKHLLSVAELINVFDKDIQIIDILPEALIASFPDKCQSPQESLNKLGGTVKIVEIFMEASLTNTDIESIVVECIDSKFADIDTKLSYGLSAYNFAQKNEKLLKKVLINVKKQLKQKNIKSRFVNKDFKNLKNAVIKGEKLIDEGLDLNLIYGNHRLFVGHSVALQDFENYSHRDYDRPHRDPKLGMLPPKLAQIMINLGGLTDFNTPSESGNSPAVPPPVIYDPFCGLGTILTEGLLLSYSVVGSDIKPGVIAKASENIEWIRKENPNSKQSSRLFQKDATTIKKVDFDKSLDLIVTESYLGPPLKKIPDKKTINKNFRYIEELLFRFLRSINPIIGRDTPIVFSVPVYREHKNFHFIKSLPDIIQKTGFKIEPIIPHQLTSKFNLAIHQRESLLYDRPDQIVGREIWKIQRAR